MIVMFCFVLLTLIAFIALVAATTPKPKMTAQAYSIHNRITFGNPK
jgi:hypothetical protein